MFQSVNFNSSLVRSARRAIVVTQDVYVRIIYMQAISATTHNIHTWNMGTVEDRLFSFHAS